MIEERLSPLSDVDGRARSARQFDVARDEVRVQVGLDDVTDHKATLISLGDVLVNIALGVDDGALALVPDEIGRVG